MQLERALEDRRQQAREAGPSTKRSRGGEPATGGPVPPPFAVAFGERLSADRWFRLETWGAGEPAGAAAASALALHQRCPKSLQLLLDRGLLRLDLVSAVPLDLAAVMAEATRCAAASAGVLAQAARAAGGATRGGPAAAKSTRSSTAAAAPVTDRPVRMPSADTLAHAVETGAAALSIAR